MPAPSFVHLRIHTEFTISDSIIRVGPLMKKVAGDGQVAVAMTDLSNIYGWIKFYKAARKAGVKPICGADCWVTNETDRDRPFRALLLVTNR
ncbi:MAG: PHP domain-containing protein, partial [Burkholderiaceae bacterium]